MHKALPLLVALLLGACATPPATTADANTAQVCVREAPIGSNFMTTKCRSQEQIAAEREAAEQAGQSINRATSTAMPKTGG